MREENSADRELCITRLFSAPRALVFEAWSKPEHLAKWWGPDGWSTETHAFEFAVGRSWRHTLRCTDGSAYTNCITFDEIVAPSRIVYSLAGEDTTVSFRSTVTFSEEGKKTRVTMRMLFPSALLLNEVVDKHGAEEGGHQTLARLEKSLAPPALDLSRTFAAPRELVFAAWSKAEHVARWFTPRPLTTSACEIDFRPGGVFRVVMRMPDGTDLPFDGKFGEIAAPERLEFVGYMPDGNEVTTLVTFSEAGGKTTMTVHQTYNFASASTRGATAGWAAALDQFDELVSQ